MSPTESMSVPSKSKMTRSYTGLCYMTRYESEGKAGENVCDDEHQRAGDLSRGRVHRQRHEARRAAGAAARHHPERHVEGVHRAEGVDLAGAAVDARDPRYAGLLHQGNAALEYDFDFWISHP